MKNNLKLYRNKLGYSQQKVADIIGIDRQTVIRHEKGTQPFYSWQESYVKLYECKFSDLIDDNHSLKEKTETFYDEDLLETVIEFIEEFIEENNLSLSAQKKARLITLSYQEMKDRKEEKKDSNQNENEFGESSKNRLKKLIGLAK